MRVLKQISASFFVLILSFVLVQTEALAQQLHGNGKVETQTRTVSGFKGIKSSGGYQIEVKLGAEESVRLEAEENLLDHIKTEVEDGVLHIYNSKGMNTNKGLKAYVTVKELNHVDISGGVKIVGTSTFEANQFILDLSGGSRITLALKAKELKADMSGGSKGTLSGSVNSFLLDASGASHIDATELVSNKAEVEASGASKVKVNATDKLGIKASGAASVYYKGDPNISPVASSTARISKL